MNIGLYGGTFDPIHCAHLIIAQFIKEELNLSKIIFIPSGNPPHKQVFGPAHLRLKMVQLSIVDNSDFECSMIEINKPDKSYSVDTIAQIKNDFNLTKENLFFIIGSDNFIELPKWKKPDKIFQMCKVVVFPRNKVDFELTPPEFRKQAIHLKNAPIIEISSTQIRSLIKR
ncbi:MAG: nicotinate-nucleotide adenylyltransferase, partial [bacterium]